MSYRNWNVTEEEDREIDRAVTQAYRKILRNWPNVGGATALNGEDAFTRIREQVRTVSSRDRSERKGPTFTDRG